MTGTWLIGLRLAIAASVFWPVGMLWLSGCLDGLSERATRRDGAGRESANIYHRAKYFHFFGLPMAIVAYCVLPFAISPAWIFGPLAATSGWFSWFQFKYYKKYL